MSELSRRDQFAMAAFKLFIGRSDGDIRDYREQICESSVKWADNLIAELDKTAAHCNDHKVFSNVCVDCIEVNKG